MTDMNTESVPAHTITRGDTVVVEDGAVIEVEWVGADEFTDDWVEIIGAKVCAMGVNEEVTLRQSKDDLVSRIVKTAEYKRQMVEAADQASREASKKETEERRRLRDEKRRQGRAADPERNTPITTRLAALGSHTKEQASSIAFDLNDDWPVMGLADREVARNHIKQMTADVERLRRASRLEGSGTH